MQGLVNSVFWFLLERGHPVRMVIGQGILFHIGGLAARAPRGGACGFGNPRSGELWRMNGIIGIRRGYCLLIRLVRLIRQIWLIR